MDDGPYSSAEPAAAPDDGERVLSVAELTVLVKGLLENTFPSLWVGGEVSNLSRPQSGHCYFTLKDEHAQVRAVLWRGTASRLSIELHDGMEVICQGGLDVYAARGSYQLNVRQIRLQGMGALELKLRRLHERLAAEGLFAAERKRPLSRFPRAIAIVTSPTGAAIRDFLEVLRQRWHGVRVLVVPVRVQGDGAAAEIAAAVAHVNRMPLPIDTLVVGRGGGSLEDLWAFNEEIVVRAIHASRIPVVSAVGHEIDVTLSDLVADVRALTPSDAAQRIVPEAAEVTQAIAELGRRLRAALRSRSVGARARLEAAAARRPLRRPFDQIHDLARRLDELDGRLRRAAWQHARAIRRRSETLRAQLDSLNPLAVLARGYSVTLRALDGQVVRDAAELRSGERIVTRFHRGEAASRVEESQ